MYNCAICSTTVGPRQPRLLNITYRDVPRAVQRHVNPETGRWFETPSPTRKEIQREEPVCPPCFKGLKEGKSRRRLAVENAPRIVVKPEVPITRLVGIPSAVAPAPLIQQEEEELRRCDICGAITEEDGQTTEDGFICASCIRKATEKSEAQERASRHGDKAARVRIKRSLKPPLSK